MTSTLASSSPVSAVWEVNSTALPPGRICGQRCVTSPCASSVTCAGVPPEEGIRDRLPTVLGHNDVAVLAPTAAEATASEDVRQGDRRAAFHRNLFQFRAGEKRNPLPVW